MSILDRWFPKKPAPEAPVNFTLPDDEGRPFTFDAEYRGRKSSVLVWYRGHW